jgi:hypothetical protein
MATWLRRGYCWCNAFQPRPSLASAEGRKEVSSTSVLASSRCRARWPASVLRFATRTRTPTCSAAYAGALYWLIGSPEACAGASFGAGGSSFTQRAPSSRQRISAAGPGRLSARLRTVMPLSGFSAEVARAGWEGCESGMVKLERRGPSGLTVSVHAMVVPEAAVR